MPAATQREDLHQRITNQIITAIEAGAGAYRMPWNPKLCTGSTVRLPHNPVGNYAYHGINILRAVGQPAGTWLRDTGMGDIQAVASGRAQVRKA